MELEIGIEYAIKGDNGDVNEFPYKYLFKKIDAGNNSVEYIAINKLTGKTIHHIGGYNSCKGNVKPLWKRVKDTDLARLMVAECDIIKKEGDWLYVKI